MGKGDLHDFRDSPLNVVNLWKDKRYFHDRHKRKPSHAIYRCRPPQEDYHVLRC